ncbi:hypothetical protein MTR_6g004860 [Medicago truncatula]|uniref:Uncharacterized protein n=1 Tax=Medicago truncatula TaxID=3880 RepID=A0A072U618_MEDTR|nr:hypothetical protein MTR_6g004860 [Medicago truncatula]
MENKKRKNNNAETCFAAKRTMNNWKTQNQGLHLRNIDDQRARSGLEKRPMIDHRPDSGL